MTTNWTVEETYITSYNEPLLRATFEAAHPKEDWGTCVPYRDDKILAVWHDETIIGFLMIHPKTPYEWSVKGHYIYNLSVHPDWRRHGVFKALLEYLTSTVDSGISPLKRLCIHVGADVPIHEFLTVDWSALGIWRDTYLEYTYPAIASTAVASAVQLGKLPNYDPKENLVYLT